MSDDDADDFIAFGKALKPLEDDAIIRKKPIAVEEQIGIFQHVHNPNFNSMLDLGVPKSVFYFLSVSVFQDSSLKILFFYSS